MSVVLKLSRPKKGALILASTFGSSAFLGVCGRKVGLRGECEGACGRGDRERTGSWACSVYLGVFIAINFGAKASNPGQRRREIVRFFYSPIFISLCLGVAVSLILIPHGFWLVEAGYRALAILAGANTFLVTMTIGVMIHFKDLRKVLPVVFLACLLKLVAQPVLVSWFSDLFPSNICGTKF